MCIQRHLLLSLILACRPQGKDSVAPDSDLSHETGTPDTPHETGNEDTDTRRETGGPDTDSGGDSTDTCTPSTWYADADDDGYGDPSASTEACDAPEGTVADATDCDDGDATRHPSAEDACYDGVDADCDAWDDNDCDHDGYASVEYGGDDCDDNDRHRYPGAPELCRDGVVNDCDAGDDGDAAAFCSGSGPFSLESADAKLIGEHVEDLAGLLLAGAGDVDGDGRDDLLVGDPSCSSYNVSVYVVSGAVEGDVSLGASEAEIHGDRGDGFGFAYQGAGDVDDDGYADLLVGAAIADRGYFFLGPTSGHVEAAAADTIFRGAVDGKLGRAAVGLGDTDGDGASDILLGAPDADGLPVDSEVGYCATEADDGLVSGEDAGIAYLFASPPPGEVEVSEADARLLGEDAGDFAGFALARPGDLDGDGLADLYISANGNCEGGHWTGAVYVVQSPVSGDVYLGDADGKIYGSLYNTEFAHTLSGAGDTNGDGTPDLLVSDPSYDLSSTAYTAGEVYLFLGPVSGSVSVLTAEATFVGEGRSYAGISIDSAGDLDADGFDDLVIGAWAASEDHTYDGAAYILKGPFSGSMDLVDADTTFVGEPGDYAGNSVAGVGDADADGLPDLLVGAFGDDDGGDDAGAAYLLLGGGALLSGDGEI